ncbi:hypothetical protein OG863_39180 [Streptomyces decoyicus]|uniref:Uncharacterized protein n=1 Tax=Streptomyces decoyicus TaxID=249567 RepID=A0ABZ1FU75_9ACTN|nr:hypothetical protein [Streptomyces decoyicus]WSB73487.1 hypothetical protein OG863_39180 [Streptomyces decoyicus]
MDAVLTVHHRLVSRALPHLRERRWGCVLATVASPVVTPINGLPLSGIGRTALAARPRA